MKVIDIRSTWRPLDRKNVIHTHAGPAALVHALAWYWATRRENELSCKIISEWNLCQLKGTSLGSPRYNKKLNWRLIPWISFGFLVSPSRKCGSCRFHFNTSRRHPSFDHQLTSTACRASVFYTHPTSCHHQHPSPPNLHPPLLFCWKVNFLSH